MNVLRILFGLEGRIGRISFAIGIVVIAVIAALTANAVIALRPNGHEFRWLFALGAGLCLMLWIQFALSWKRLHDFEAPGVFTIGLFIPVISTLLLIFLCFWPGDTTPNEFGAPPDQE